MENQWKMRTADFYQLLKNQDYRCALSGEDLTPESTCLARKVPLQNGGHHEFTNTYLVHRSVHPLTKHCSQAEIFELCQKIIDRVSPNPISHATFSKKDWDIYHDRIITFNKTAKDYKKPACLPQTWAEIAAQSVSSFNRDSAKLAGSR